LKEVVEKGDVEELRDAVEKLCNILEHVELDLEVNEAILAGTWPGSVKHLSHALRRAIEYEEKKNTIKK